MAAFLITVVLGIVVSVLGIINMTGNISSLHSYHRHRVSEQDRKPFGRMIGLGTLIIGISMVIYGVLFLVFEYTQLQALVVVGIIELFAGIIVGLILSVYAMKKYNGGIF